MVVDIIQIEALFAPGCDSRDATLAMIEKIITNHGSRFDLKVSTIQSIKQANEKGFLGSPSIMVNGQDIETESRGRLDYGVG